MADELLVGAGEACITPPVGTGLAGYFHNRVSTTVRDDLFAKALVVERGGATVAILAFYRPDYVLMLGPDGKMTPTRANFLCDRSGRVAWLRLGGRLASHRPPGTRSTATPPPAAPTVHPRIDWLRPWTTTMIPPR